MAKPRWVARSAWVLGGLSIATLAAVFFAFGCNLASIGQRLDTEGVTTTATIVAKDERSRRVNPKAGLPEYAPDYFVTYRFVDSGGGFAFNETRVSATFFRRVGVGATTPVRYLPDSSMRSEVEFGSTGALSFQGVFGGGMGIISGLGMALVALLKPRWLAI